MFYFSSGGHVFWSSVMSDTIFNLDSLKIIVVKFGYDPFGSFRGEDLRKSLRRRRRTPNDSNTSLGPRRAKTKLIVKIYMKKVEI